MPAEHSTVSDIGNDLTTLFVHLRRLEGGEEAVDEFSTWFFQNAAWDDRSDDEALVDLGSGITSILYQWGDLAPRMTVEMVVREIDEELQAHGISRIHGDRAMDDPPKGKVRPIGETPARFVERTLGYPTPSASGASRRTKHRRLILRRHELVSKS